MGYDSRGSIEIDPGDKHRHYVEKTTRLEAVHR